MSTDTLPLHERAHRYMRSGAPERFCWRETPEADGTFVAFGYVRRTKSLLWTESFPTAEAAREAARERGLAAHEAWQARAAKRAKRAERKAASRKPTREGGTFTSTYDTLDALLAAHPDLSLPAKVRQTYDALMAAEDTDEVMVGVQLAGTESPENQTFDSVRLGAMRKSGSFVLFTTFAWWRNYDAARFTWSASGDPESKAYLSDADWVRRLVSEYRAARALASGTGLSWDDLQRRYARDDSDFTLEWTGVAGGVWAHTAPRDEVSKALHKFAKDGIVAYRAKGAPTDDEADPWLALQWYGVLDDSLQGTEFYVESDGDGWRPGTYIDVDKELLIPQVWEEKVDRHFDDLNDALRALLDFLRKGGFVGGKGAAR